MHALSSVTTRPYLLFQPCLSGLGGSVHGHRSLVGMNTLRSREQ